LSSLREPAAKSSIYWATQIDIQSTAVAAWLAHAEGNDSQALALMRKAAQLEAATEKHPVTPGEVLPRGSCSAICCWKPAATRTRA
jgi:hypothetical protein